MVKITKKRKGEISTSMIVTIIILLISVGIILFFFSLYADQGAKNKELCHVSVILRSSATLGKFQFKESLPLQCKTERVCLTSGMFGKCESLGKNSFDNPIRKESVDNRNKVLDVISEVLYEDNEMLGGGLVNPMPRDFFTLKGETTYCMITSKIALDSEIKDKIGEIKNKELFEYMIKKKNSEGKNYMNLIYGYGGDIRDLGISEDKVFPIDFSNDQAVVVMFKEKSLLEALGVGSITGGLTFAVLSIGTGGVGSFVLVTSAVVSGWATYKNLDDPRDSRAFVYVSPQLVPYTADALRALNCNYIETLPS